MELHLRRLSTGGYHHHNYYKTTAVFLDYLENNDIDPNTDILELTEKLVTDSMLDFESFCTIENWTKEPEISEILNKLKNITDEEHKSRFMQPEALKKREFLKLQHQLASIALAHPHPEI